MPCIGWPGNMFARDALRRRRLQRSCLQVERLENRVVPTLLGNALFPADNPWNQKITSAPVAGNSGTLVGSIGLTSSMHADFGSGTYAGGDIGIPFNVVAGNQAKITVVIDAYASESDLLPIPIPANALIEGDPLPAAQNTGDRHLLVYDKDNNIVYETFNTHRPSEEPDGQWHADAEAVWNLNQDSFRTPGFTSADAAGLPILPGLVRPDEVLDQGVITHAIRFTVPSSQSPYVFPASHQAGGSNTALPRMGERFRLKQSFDISGFSAANRVILQALKDYGMIVADNGSGWYLSGEPSSRWDNNDLHNLGTLNGSDFEAVDLTPAVSGLGQASGPATGGTAVTINGHGFSGSAGLQKVFFGNLAASAVNVVSDTQITAVAPAQAAATVDVIVQTPYGTSPASTVDHFTYTPAGPQPGQLQFSAALYRVNETAGNAVITVTRSNGVTGAVTVHYATTDAAAKAGTDYASAAGTLSFADGQVSATFNVQILVDNQIQGPESLNLTLSNPGGGATLGSTLSATLTITDDDAAPNQRFIGQVYLDILQRPAEPAAIMSWSAVLDRGASRVQVVHAIESSAEYRSKQVQGAYLTILHRAADNGGLNSFVSFLTGGGTVEQVDGILAGSGEYFVNRGAGTNGGFVDALYRDALGRQADAGGRASFLTALANGVSRQAVADIIFRSDEYRADVIQSFYQRFLHRPADSAGLAGWVAAYHNGLRDEDAIAQIVGSAEYFSEM